MQDCHVCWYSVQDENQVPVLQAMTHLPNKRLIPRLSPRINKIWQATESWAGPGNEAIVYLQYPATKTKIHVMISLNSRTKTVRNWRRFLFRH